MCLKKPPQPAACQQCCKIAKDALGLARHCSLTLMLSVLNSLRPQRMEAEGVRAFFLPVRVPCWQ